MADPPWQIRMDLPYGVMSDDEMRQLRVAELQASLLSFNLEPLRSKALFFCVLKRPDFFLIQLQDQGLLFLWVTHRAMELSRELLEASAQLAFAPVQWDPAFTSTFLYSYIRIRNGATNLWANWFGSRST